MKTLNIFVSLSFFLLSSCATILTGRSDMVKIDTYPKGAVVYLNNEPMGMTPMTLTLKRSEDAYIKISKEGYKVEYDRLLKSFNTAFLGNIFFVYFFWVDLMTGAVKHYDYRLPLLYNLEKDDSYQYAENSLPKKSEVIKRIDRTEYENDVKNKITSIGVSISSEKTISQMKKEALLKSIINVLENNYTMISHDLYPKSTEKINNGSILLEEIKSKFSGMIKILSYDYTIESTTEYLKVECTSVIEVNESMIERNYE